MKRFIWKARYCYYFCRELHDFKFWNYWWIGEESLKSDSAHIDYHPRDLVLEELSYWGD